MSNRSFIILAVSVAAVGGLLGGLFIGGYELGKRNAPGDELPTADLATLPSPGGGAVTLGAGGQPDEATLSQLRQALGSGQFEGNIAGGGGGGGFAGFAGAFGGGPGGGGVFGTIEAVEGDVVRVSTPQGPIEVSIDGQTDIQGMATLDLDDLEAGASITVTGQRDESGGMTATSVFVLPEGAGGFGGGGFGGRGFNLGQRGSGDTQSTDDNE